MANKTGFMGQFVIHLEDEIYNIKRRFDHKLRTRARDLAINFRVLREEKRVSCDNL